MHQIHLLIFDECHHARSRHPYNRIMQQFYHAQVGGRLGLLAEGVDRAAAAEAAVFGTAGWLPYEACQQGPQAACHCDCSMQEALFSPRPHIFGMTAAPADVKRNETQVGRKGAQPSLRTGWHCTWNGVTMRTLLPCSQWSSPGGSLTAYWSHKSSPCCIQMNGRGACGLVNQCRSQPGLRPRSPIDANAPTPCSSLRRRTWRHASVCWRPTWMRVWSPWSTEPVWRRWAARCVHGRLR